MTDPLQDILSRLQGVRPQGDQWEAQCPAHDDQRASLSVSRGADGRVLLHCHAGCSPIQVVQALGLRMGALFPPRERRRPAPGQDRIVATYDYLDAEGTLLFQVVRFEPKSFRQRRPDESTPGGWTWSVKGVSRVLYRLPEILKADPATTILFIVEGEKDADNLNALDPEHLNMVATCNPGGAGKWRDEYAGPLTGRRVVILPDKDAPGRAHAQHVARRLHGKAAQVKVMELPGEGKDVSDWIERPPT